MPELLRVSKLAELKKLGCKETIYGWLADGTIPGGRQIKGRWFISSEDLRRFLCGENEVTKGGK